MRRTTQAIREPLPSRYRSDSLKLILFGSMAAGSKNQAILVNNKAYADIRAIALASDGGFLPEMRTLHPAEENL